MFTDPVVSLMLVVCESCRGSVFAEAGGDCEAAGAGAYYQHVVDVHLRARHGVLSVVGL